MHKCRLDSEGLSRTHEKTNQVSFLARRTLSRAILLSTQSTVAESYRPMLVKKIGLTVH